MNKTRREKLNEAVKMLREAGDIIETCKNDEEYAFDNLPESFQYGSRGEKMQDCIDTMDDVLSQLDETIESIEYVIFMV